MRLGIAKLENYVFVCLCSRLSLSLQPLMDKFVDVILPLPLYSCFTYALPADYYLCTLGDVYKAALPSGLKMEAGDRNIYKGYVSFRCYKGSSEY